MAKQSGNKIRTVDTQVRQLHNPRRNASIIGAFEVAGSCLVPPISHNFVESKNDVTPPGFHHLGPEEPGGGADEADQRAVGRRHQDRAELQEESQDADTAAVL